MRFVKTATRFSSLDPLLEWTQRKFSVYYAIIIFDLFNVIYICTDNSSLAYILSTEK